MFKIYHAGTSPNMLQCMTLLLDEEGLGYSMINDVGQMMRVTRGNMNPNTGFVAVANDDAIIRDIFDLCDWINKKGLRRI